jgi:hypothetical protein
MCENVDRGAGEVLGAHLRARLSYREDLGMSGRIVSLSDLVGTLGQDLAVLDDDRGEGAATFFHIAPSEVNGPLREVHVGSFVQSYTRPRAPAVARSGPWGLSSCVPQ